jgi:putative sterol carrier protein
MSQLKFMSKEWFDKVREIREAAGDVETPSALHDLVINITVTDTDEGDKEMSLVSGMIEEGHHESAPTTMILPVDLAHRIFIDNDQSAGMQGFMSGQIKIEGDMSKLMALQTAQPSADQIELMKKIQEVTHV